MRAVAAVLLAASMIGCEPSATEPVIPVQISGAWVGGMPGLEMQVMFVEETSDRITGTAAIFVWQRNAIAVQVEGRYTGRPNIEVTLDDVGPYQPFTLTGQVRIDDGEAYRIDGTLQGSGFEGHRIVLVRR